MRVVELARIRQASYRLLAQVFLFPVDQRLEDLAAIAAELAEHESWWSETAIDTEWARLVRELAAIRPAGYGALQSEYSARFLANPAAVPCPVQESAYLGDDAGLMAAVLADLEREYAGAGLGLSPQAETPPDHLATELEFAAYLCGKEEEAWACRSLPAAAALLRQELRFLARHPGRWVRWLAGRVEAFGGAGLYPAASRAAEALLAHEAGLLEALDLRYRPFATAEREADVPA